MELRIYTRWLGGTVDREMKYGSNLDNVIWDHYRSARYADVVIYPENGDTLPWSESLARALWSYLDNEGNYPR